MPSIEDAQVQLERLSPLVASFLGVEERPVTIGLDPDLDWIAQYRAGHITLGPGSIDQLDLTVAHELTHAFMGEDLRRMSAGLREGVADWVSAVLTNRVRYGGEPEPEYLLEAITITDSQLRKLPPDHLDAVRGAAMWVASKLLPLHPVSSTQRPP